MANASWSISVWLRLLTVAALAALTVACSDSGSGGETITLPDTTQSDLTGQDLTADTVQPDTTADAQTDDTAVPDVTPDVEPDVEPDVAGEVTPDVQPDVVPDVEPEVVEDIVDVPDTVEVVEDVQPDIQPDVQPDVQPDIVDTADTQEPTWGTFTPSGCTKFVNTNGDGTVNPFISPARDGQFYVSYVAKGGNLMLAWEDPTTCKTVVAPMQVNKTAGAVYYWGAVAVVSDKAGNFYAVWEGAFGTDAEISFAWSKTGKDFSAPIELVSTSTNGQDPALWVPASGEVHAAWRGHHAFEPWYDPYYAFNGSVFSGGSFSPGVLVHADAEQDDQVAIGGDSMGNLYLAWQTFDGDIFIARSTDEGKTWSAPKKVNDETGKANVGKASFMVITPDDRVVLMWSDSRTDSEGDVYADSSADGLTWGVDVMVNDNTARYQEDPSMVVATATACKGAIYAVWQDMRNKSSYDIYAARSTDGGKTWSANEAIAKDVEGDEMNPAIAVDQSCKVGVAWRDATKNDSFDIGSTYFTW